MRYIISLLLGIILLVLCLSRQVQAQPWIYTYTNSDHTIILLNDPNNYTINGQAIQAGDCIGAFYEDANGNLACGGYFVWYNFAPLNESVAIFGASQGNDNGFEQGEEIVWKIWQASTNQEFLAEPNYNLALPDSGYFNENGVSMLLSLSASTQNSPSPWTYTINNTSHSIILLNDANNYLVDHEPIQAGDFIGVFYEDENGNPACAGYFEWHYFAPNNESMSAFGAFETDNGFQQGENFSWKIWRASDSTVFDAIPIYNSNLPNQGSFAENGISLLSNLTSVPLADSLPGSCLFFDGNNDYLDGSGIPTNLSEFTIEAWIYHTSLPSSIQRYVSIAPEVIVLCHDGANGNGGNEQLHFYIKKSDGSLYSLRVDNALSLNLWTHIAGTYDGTDMMLYLNGELVSSQSPAGGLFSPNGDIRFSHPTETHHGKMDEITLWDYVRSIEEIREDMHRTLQGRETGLLNYWQFNEEQGTNARDIISGHHASMINMDNSNWATSTVPIPFCSENDGNWTDTSKWLSGQGYPASTWAMVQVNSNLNLNENVELLELIVSEGKCLHLPAGIGLTVSDTINNQAGTSGIILEADATTRATIIQSSSRVQATVKQYLTQGDYHYISSPISNQDISPEFVNANTNPLPSTVDFYKFDEAANLWRNIKDGSGNLNPSFETQFETGRGYAYANSDASYTKEFKGELICSTQSISLSKQGNTANNGWNLIGNIFPANLAANTSADASHNFLSDNASALDDNHEAIYFYDGNDYAAVNQASSATNIPPTQAFFVKATSDGAELTFNAQCQKHGTSTFYKNTSAIPRFTIGIESPEGALNETMLAFIDGTSKGLDPGYDAQKLKGNYYIALYSLLVDDDGNDYAIQSLPQVDNQQVKLGLNASQTGLYEFSNFQMENMNYSTIFLEDKTENLWVNLNLNPSYQFVLQQAGSFEDRFVLHFGGIVTDIEEASDTEMPFTILCNGEHILLQNLSDKMMSGSVHVHNLAGQVLAIDQVNVDAHSNEVHTPELAAGLYLVSFHTGSKIFTQKVVLSKKK